MKRVFFLLLIVPTGCLFSGGSGGGNENNTVITINNSNNDDGDAGKEADISSNVPIEEVTLIEIDCAVGLAEQEQQWDVNIGDHIPIRSTKFRFSDPEGLFEPPVIAWADIEGDTLRASFGLTTLIRTFSGITTAEFDVTEGEQVLQISDLTVGETESFFRVTTDERLYVCNFPAVGDAECVIDDSLSDAFGTAGLVRAELLSYAPVFDINGDAATTVFDEFVVAASGTLSSDASGIGAAVFAVDPIGNIEFNGVSIDGQGDGFPQGHQFAVRTALGPTRDAGGFPYIVSRFEDTSVVHTYDGDSYRPFVEWDIHPLAETTFGRFSFFERSGFSGAWQGAFTVDAQTAIVDFGYVSATDEQLIFHPEGGQPVAWRESFDLVRTPQIWAGFETSPLIILSNGDNVFLASFDMVDRLYVSPELSELAEIYDVVESLFAPDVGPADLIGPIEYLGRRSGGGITFGRRVLRASATRLSTNDFCARPDGG